MAPVFAPPTFDPFVGTTGSLVSDGGTLFAPSFFEFDGVVYIIPREPAEALTGVTQTTRSIETGSFSANNSMNFEAFQFTEIDSPIPDPDPTPDPDPDPMPDADETFIGSRAADVFVGGSGNDDIRGRAGEDDLGGGAGDDALRGGGGADTLDGGAGVDLLIGGGGSDVLVFAAGNGSDTIGDFDSRGDDVIDLDIEAVNSFQDVLDAAEQIGRRVELDFGDGDVLTLARTSISDLSADDFLL